MDQSASDFIDNLLKKEDEFGYTVYLAPVSSSTLQNHKIGRAGCGRIIYVIADIYPHNLNANSTAIPTEYIRNWISQGGYACDKVGFIVPTEFGGSAEYFNVYPQSTFVSSIFTIFFTLCFSDDYARLGQ